MKQSERDQRRRAGLTTGERERLKQFKCDVVEIVVGGDVIRADVDIDRLATLLRAVRSA